MSSSTRATKALEQAGAQFTVHHYDCDLGAVVVCVVACVVAGD